MILFYVGFSSAMIAIVLLFILYAIFHKKDTSSNDRHFRLLEEQLRVFNERMVEERRLSCALETIVEHVTSVNKQSVAQG